MDLLVPLETNLEKDTKVVQHEQKKFMQQHKVRMESYQKAVSTMKKQRKKKATPENTEKELRVRRLYHLYIFTNPLPFTELATAGGSEKEARCLLRSELQERKFLPSSSFVPPIQCIHSRTGHDTGATSLWIRAGATVFHSQTLDGLSQHGQDRN